MIDNPNDPYESLRKLAKTQTERALRSEEERDVLRLERDAARRERDEVRAAQALLVMVLHETLGVPVTGDEAKDGHAWASALLDLTTKVATVPAHIKRRRVLGAALRAYQAIPPPPPGLVPAEHEAAIRAAREQAKYALNGEL